MKLYHTGYLEIREPDIRHGRKSADFGQGFYTTANEEFAVRWARERKDADTIFDTFGIITSGVLAPKESMQLLMIGPKYEQIALKSEKAASQLKWLGGRVLSKDEVARYRAVVEAEQAEYQKLFAEAMVKL